MSTKSNIYTNAEISAIKKNLKGQPTNYIRYQINLLLRQVEERKILLALAEQELLERRDEG